MGERAETTICRPPRSHLMMSSALTLLVAGKSEGEERRALTGVAGRLAVDEGVAMKAKAKARQHRARIPWTRSLRATWGVRQGRRTSMPTMRRRNLLLMRRRRNQLLMRLTRARRMTLLQPQVTLEPRRRYDWFVRLRDA